MSKTRTGFRRAHCLAPVVGGGGYLVTGLGSVNRPFWAFATIPRNPRIWPQKPPRAAEGLPSKSVAIRLRLGNILISNRRSRTFRPRHRCFECEPRPSGRRLSSCRLRGCQPILFRTPGRSPDASGSSNQDPASKSGRANPSGLQPRGCRRLEPFRFPKLFQRLAPRQQLRSSSRSERRRLSSGRPPGCQPAFFRSLADPRETRIFWRGPGLQSLRSGASHTFPARRSTSRRCAASFGFSRTCAPADPSVAARFRAEAAIYWRAGSASTGIRKESRRPMKCRTGPGGARP